MPNQGETLRVWRAGHEGTPIFLSDGRWLHPLFDLGDFLDSHPEISRDSLELRDRVIGRAAAFLIVRAGIQTAGAGVVSRRAVPVFEAHGVTWTAGDLVERIGCQTEDLLAEVTDPDEAWVILLERRQKARGGPPDILSRD